ncbi:hypothetical protein DSO57_1014434 [Entomophthora muscae]|uniref:Uncharacterized protein n=1 Tax=Entomophthora muscae TaxID=34485 RepID=A0ACC2RKB3_9FUNG|nr:hypothetical protein DSO57_1014434 [Entomophthora muscae]
MILPVLKFVVFFLAPFLLLFWSTSPNLWTLQTSSTRFMSDDLSSLLHFPSDMLTPREPLVKSPTCNDLDLYSTDSILPASGVEELSSSPPPLQESADSAPLLDPGVPTLAPSCAPWLITSLVLMALNTYFPQLSPVSSLKSPLRAAVPVIHWTASWWFVSPRWEPNLVSLAPHSHTRLVQPLGIIPTGPTIMGPRWGHNRHWKRLRQKLQSFSPQAWI